MLEVERQMGATEIRQRAELFSNDYWLPSKAVESPLRHFGDYHLPERPVRLAAAEILGSTVRSALEGELSGESLPRGYHYAPETNKAGTVISFDVEYLYSSAREVRGRTGNSCRYDTSEEVLIFEGQANKPPQDHYHPQLTSWRRSGHFESSYAESTYTHIAWFAITLPELGGSQLFTLSPIPKDPEAKSDTMLRHVRFPKFGSAAIGHTTRTPFDNIKSDWRTKYERALAITEYPTAESYRQLLSALS